MNASRLKVLHIPQWYPSRVGQNQVAGTFCREHVLAGSLYDDMAVLAYASRSQHWPSLHMECVEDQGVPTWYASYGHSPLPKTTWLSFWLNLVIAIRRVVQEWGKPDVIHTQDAYAYPVMRCSRYLGVPYVISQHWTGWGRKVVSARHSKRYRYAFRKAACVLSANYFAEQEYANYGIAARTVWLPNTLDTDCFSPYPSVEREPWLLHASGFTEQKRFPDILKAFAIVKREHPEAILQVVGDGDALPRMKVLAGELLPKDSYRFHGFIPKPKLADLMRHSRGFIFPSSYETFGCVLMESMACGCPVLTTRVGGIPAIVPEGDGLFVEVGDIEAISSGMNRMLDGTHGLNVERISQETRARFSRETVGRILHEEYRAAIREYSMRR